MWDYPASQAWKWLMLIGAVIIMASLDPIVISEWDPNYYQMAGGLTIVGTGCAMLAYHIRKGDEEDITTKKKIILAGMMMVIMRQPAQTTSRAHPYCFSCLLILKCILNYVTQCSFLYDSHTPIRCCQ